MNVDQILELRQKIRAMEDMLGEVSQTLLVEIGKTNKSQADYFIPTLAANVDNETLSDADFREFVRNSIKGMK